MLTYKRIAVVGSREFKNYLQLKEILDNAVSSEDWLISGGALGADSMAQRYAKERGLSILIIYPNWALGKGAGLIRNKTIVENADKVIAFYQKGRFQQGGTSNTAMWARKLGVDLLEYEEV
jgi:predicted Rossmann fold nucleotide-binding protein DprA/Smf involved in DNA uptake